MKSAKSPTKKYSLSSETTTTTTLISSLPRSTCIPAHKMKFYILSYLPTCMYISHLYKCILQQPRENTTIRADQNSALYHPHRPGYEGEIDLDRRRKMYRHGFLQTIRTCTYPLLTYNLQILHAIADYKMMVVARLQKPVKDAHHDAARYLQL